MHAEGKIEGPVQGPALEYVDEEGDEKPAGQDAEKDVVDDSPDTGSFACHAPDKKAHADLDKRHGGEEGDLVNAAELETKSRTSVG